MNIKRGGCIIVDLKHPAFDGTLLEDADFNRNSKISAKGYA
jgi:hypothetical protein